MAARFGARCLDGLIVGAASFVVMLAGVAVVALTGGLAHDDVAPGGLAALLVLQFGTPATYEIILNARGGTVGKRVAGLRLISTETGQAPGVVRAAGRYGVWLAGCVVVIGGLVVYASPLWDASGWRRGWHDRAAGVVVVWARPVRV